MWFRASGVFCSASFAREARRNNSVLLLAIHCSLFQILDSIVDEVEANKVAKAILELKE